MVEQQQVDPYGFVQLVGEPERLPATPHYRFGDYSGRLTCTLTAKTPLFVYHPQFARQVGRGHQEARFPVREGVAIIPGSSLKGVIRSVVEAVEASCFTLFDGPTYRGSGITKGQQIRAELPDDYRHCTQRNQLCPACRLFGFLYKDEVYAGKIHIGDATAPQESYTLMDSIILEVLSAPKPEGRPRAYVVQKGSRNVVRGRKFYRHRLDGVLARAGGKKDRQNKTVQPVAPGSVFTFEVEYNDLRESELRLLLYALILEPGLWHKVGLGKPIGLGSAHIEIVEWRKIDRQARYQELGGGLADPLTGDALQAELERWLQSYRESDALNLQDLRELWRYEHNYDVRYQMRQSGRT
jgi:CRISPR/Cas system CSM-associated protein Csm3 (group 7 of RAMP superfamily)